jgi:hypothetical protein
MDTDNTQDGAEPPPESAGSIAVSRFRKKSEVVEAVRYDGTKASFDFIWDWMERETGEPDGGPNQGYEGTGESPGCFGIVTLEGEMKASAGDVIIRGVKGEFYPCKPDIFAATYEPFCEARALSSRTTVSRAGKIEPKRWRSDRKCPER